MLLNLQRVVIALVNNMAIAENIAYQTINPCRRRALRPATAEQ